MPIANRSETVMVSVFVLAASIQFVNCLRWFFRGGHSVCFARPLSKIYQFTAVAAKRPKRIAFADGFFLAGRALHEFQTSYDSADQVIFKAVGYFGPVELSEARFVPAGVIDQNLPVDFGRLYFHSAF